jgi:SAM-dependent methyltransferase
VQFCCGDGETLPFVAGAFSAVVCECAFCTFPDKQAGAREMHRTLRGPGRLGLSDVALERPLPPELHQLATWVLCIADARRAEDYQAILRRAGFAEFTQSDLSWALRETVAEAGRRLMAIELGQKLGKLPDMVGDLEAAKATTRRAAEFVEAGGAGYILLIADKERRPGTGNAGVRTSQ